MLSGTGDRLPGEMGQAVRPACITKEAPICVSTGVPAKTATGVSIARSFQSFWEIAVNAGPLLYGYKGVGIDGTDGMKQLLNFIFGQAYTQHVNTLAGIGAGSGPECDAAGPAGQ